MPHARSARDLIQEFFGLTIPIIPRESAVTVGTSAVAIGSYARQRVAITVSNPGINAIIIGFNSGVTTTSGLTVGAGAFVSYNWYRDGELVMLDLWAISGSAAQTLYVCESVLMGV